MRGMRQSAAVVLIELHLIISLDVKSTDRAAFWEGDLQRSTADLVGYQVLNLSYT
jgi:hypothetical protein